MTYRVIGIMSGSSLDGLDIAFVELNESGGKWTFTIEAADCYAYNEAWIERLSNATGLPAYEYQLLHTDYGRYIGAQVSGFIQQHGLEHQVQLIASHGHTTFHAPHLHMTAQLGDGAAIAASTEINVVSDLRALDVAFGGQGAPIVPVAEKLLLNEYDYFLNLGGIANISFNHPQGYIAFDVCAANRVLNLLAQQEGQAFDKGGRMAALGTVNTGLLTELNALYYYKLPYPKSLANHFGINEVLPVIQAAGLPTADALRTYTEHIAMQIANGIRMLHTDPVNGVQKLLVTGGGAFNTFLVDRLTQAIASTKMEVVVPDQLLVNYKEAVAMALIGVLRWREEYNVLHSVTGAARSSIGGAVWIGQEA